MTSKCYFDPNSNQKTVLGVSRNGELQKRVFMFFKYHQASALLASTVAGEWGAVR